MEKISLWEALSNNWKDTKRRISQGFLSGFDFAMGISLFVFVIFASFIMLLGGAYLFVLFFKWIF